MKIFKKAAIMLVLVTVLAVQFAMADNTAKSQNAERQFRIGYLEQGEFWGFTEIVKAVRTSLSEMKWGEKVEFPKDAWFSPGWEPEKKEEARKKAKELMERKDIDLIISAGTDATKIVLEANNHHTPIISIGVSDPVKSGFVKDEKDSGVDNYTARVQVGRYKRMIRIFHDAVGFKTLGLMHPDTESGRIYANVEDAYDVAKERGFKVIEYKKLSTAEKTGECLAGLQQLTDQKMDAFFIPPLNCFDWKTSDAKKLFDFLVENKIPTFAREGTKYVKAGALMGFSSIDFSTRGKFISEKIIKILQGQKPRSLPMVDNAIPKISLNLLVAEKIGFTPPFDIIGASDEIFQEITLPDNRLVK